MFTSTRRTRNKAMLHCRSPDTLQPQHPLVSRVQFHGDRIDGDDQAVRSPHHVRRAQIKDLDPRTCESHRILDLGSSIRTLQPRRRSGGNSRRRCSTRRFRHAIHLGVGVHLAPRRILRAGDRDPGEVIGLAHPIHCEPEPLSRPPARVFTLHSSPLHPGRPHSPQ